MTDAQRPLPHRVDHYYWLTSLLAARGVQALTSRFVAVTLALIGVVPGILAFTSDSYGLPARIGAAVVLACCLVLAGLWLRHTWPSRRQSQRCVVLGSVCLAYACLSQPDPAVGLIAATSFVSLSAYIACFHNRRLLAVVWTAAVVSLVILGVEVGQTNVALAICGAVVVTWANVLTAFAGGLAINLADHNTKYADLDSLTGLLSREAFDEEVAALIGARSRTHDRFLLIAVVGIDHYPTIASSGASAANRARITASRQLRETARRDAVIAHPSESEFVVAELFASDDPTALLERIRKGMTITPLHMCVSIGAVFSPLHKLQSCPPPAVIDEMLAVATGAVDRARTDGGNSVELVMDPDLDAYKCATDF